MKRILCFGDSNTFGTNGSTGMRFDDQIRWTGVLRAKLGDQYAVIEEGLGGRTTVWDDPIELYKNGRTYLMPCLYSHMPLDLVVIMLGTNDLKKRFNLPACDIAAGVEVLINDILSSECGRDGGAPNILLVAPIMISGLTELAEMLEDGEEKSKRLPALYRQLADKHGIYFWDCNEAVKPGKADGVHFDEQGHQQFAQGVYTEINKILR